MAQDAWRSELRNGVRRARCAGCLAVGELGGGDDGASSVGETGTDCAARSASTSRIDSMTSANGTQHVMAQGTPTSATTAVAPRTLVAQKVATMHAAYHASASVHALRGVSSLRIHRPTGPTREGSEGNESARVVR